MRSIVSTLLITSLSLVLAAPSLVGCAAPEADDEATTGASAVTEDPRASLATNARAIVLSEGGTSTGLGAPEKIAAVMKAMEGTIVALGGAPRCGPPRYSLELLDAEAKPMASLDVCGTDKGFLKIDARWFEVPIADADLHGVFAEAPAIGDLLWGATTVQAADGDRSSRSSVVTSYKKAFDLDAVPETRSATPRCAPLTTFRFWRGATEIATVAVFCPANEDDTAAPATITVDGRLVGWSTFDIARAFGGGF